MTSQNQPQLSKSRFMAGLQRLKRLYLECHHRELAGPVGVGQQAIFESGTAVGELAREMFPGGRLVEEQYYEPREAEKMTVRPLSDDSVPSLFEPAFTFEGVHARVDILRRTEGDEFDLIPETSALPLDFSVKTGTVMQSSNLPLHKWALAMFLMTTNLKGVSSMKLSRDLGITQRSAWHLAHRIIPD